MVTRIEYVSIPLLPLPDPPTELPVRFVDMPEKGGLFLTYDDGRALAKNVTEIRGYTKQLLEVIAYYETRLKEFESKNEGTRLPPASP